MSEEKSNYEKLVSLNVKEKTEKKNGLTYLSWAWGWAEFLKVHPDATYEVLKNADGLPYFSDNSGACVFTTVKADGITREMWLPVMDGANKAMKAEAYTFLDRYKKEKTVAAFTMFDINKTIMRCLTKNLAMFGLALYIYAGEDMPETEEVKTNPHEDGGKKNEQIKNDFKAHMLSVTTIEALDAEYKKCEAAWNKWPEAWIEGMKALYLRREKELTK